MTNSRWLAVLVCILCAHSSLALPASSDHRNSPALVKRMPFYQFCHVTFRTACRSTCDDAGHLLPARKVTCFYDPQGDRDRWRFGCICSDGSDRLARALLRSTGDAAEEVVTQGTYTKYKTVTSLEDVHVVTTPVKKTTARATISSFTTARSDKTSSVFELSSYAGGDIPSDNNRRASSAPFCKSFTAACPRYCKTIKKTTSSPYINTCSKVATTDDYQVFELSCHCTNIWEDSQQDVLDDFFGDPKRTVVPTTTIGRTVPITVSATTPTQITLRPTFIETARTSTNVIRNGTTTIKTAKTPVATKQIPLTGRVRVDRIEEGTWLSPGKKYKKFGYYTLESYTGDPYYSPYVQFTNDTKSAAPLKLVLETDGTKNVWGFRTGNGLDRLWISQSAIIHHLEDELGGSEPPSQKCGELTHAAWDTEAYPFGPSDVEQYEPEPLYDYVYESYDDYGRAAQTFTWTLGDAQPNPVNPDRKIQVPMYPFWYRHDGQYVRPYPVLYANVRLNADGDSVSFMAFANAPVSSGTGCGNYDVVHWFEPDAI